METADLANLIKTRRSIRRWEDKGVPEELLLQAVELATHAPNGGNFQNWRFFIVTNRRMIQAMGDAVQSTAGVIATWPEAASLGDALHRYLPYSSFFRQAPAVIAIATGDYQSPMDRVLAAREGVDERAAEMRQWRIAADTRIQSVASAIAYLLLVLHQMGLGAVWMTGPMQARGELEKLLSVPADKFLVALVPVGYPAENPAIKERKPVSEVSEVIR